MTTAAEPLLAIDSLSVSYGGGAERVRAVRDVSLTIAPGEAFGLIGESGSGKTTVAFAVMRYLRGGRVDGGTIRLRGRDLLALDEAELGTVRGGRIAMVYQDPLSALNPILAVGEQIAEGLRRHRPISRREAETEALALLAQVHLPDPARFAQRYPHQLSGGQQQRVVIAMALACRPELLIMDEPTTGLDVTTEAVILDLVAELRAQLGLSILFISHNLGVVAKICHRVGVLYAGELMEIGSVAAVLRRPSHPYTRALLAAVPRLDRRQARLAALPGQPPDLRQAVPGCGFADRCPDAAERCRAVPPTLRRLPGGTMTRCHFDPPPTAIGIAAAEEVRADGSAPVLRASGLSKTFRVPGSGRLWSRPAAVTALDDVSLELRRGETLAVVGESGSGKTTLARCIAGLVAPDRGSIDFGGERLDGRRSLAQRRHVQIVFQNPEAALNPLHTVEEIVARPILLYGLRRGNQVRRRVVELLDMVKLGERYLAAYPRELSGGQKQRVSLARAFAAEPAIVICDEPTSSLDISVQAALLNELKALQARLGTSYLFITHDLGVVNAIADRVVVMYLGRIVENGPVSEVFAPPHHPYTEALISAVPTIEPARHGATLRLLGSPPRLGEHVAGCVFHTRCARKLGTACERDAPPVRDLGRSHRFACHIMPGNLASAQRARLTATDAQGG